MSLAGGNNRGSPEWGAEQAVSSWVFRRARADRAYLLAVFTYAGDKTSAVVRPQPAPSPAPAAGAAPPAPQGS